LTALGTAVLVSTARPEVLQRLSTDIFNLWLDVFGELKEAQDRREGEKYVDLSWKWTWLTFLNLVLNPNQFLQIALSASGSWMSHQSLIIKEQKEL
jgi:hypothetical protein